MQCSLYDGNVFNNMKVLFIYYLCRELPESFPDAELGTYVF